MWKQSVLQFMQSGMCAVCFLFCYKKRLFCMYYFGRTISWISFSVVTFNFQNFIQIVNSNEIQWWNEIQCFWRKFICQNCIRGNCFQRIILYLLPLHKGYLFWSVQLNHFRDISHSHRPLLKYIHTSEMPSKHILALWKRQKLLWFSNISFCCKRPVQLTLPIRSLLICPALNS